MGRLLQKLPVLCAVAIVPIFFRGHLLEVSQELQPLSKFWTSEFDLFTWWKSQVVIGCGIASLVFIFYSLLKNKISETAQNFQWLVLTYAVFIIVSSFLSPFQHTAWLGIANYNEGALVLLSYLALMVAGFLFIRTVSDISGLYLASAVAVSGVFIIACIQSRFGNFLMLPGFRQIAGSNETYEFYSYFRPLVSTLLTSNHLGSFAALCFPLMLSYTLLLKGKKRLVGIGLTLMTIYLAIGSESRGAWLSILLVFFIYLFLFGKVVLKYPLAILTLVVGIILVAYAFSGPVSDKIEATYHDLTDFTGKTTTPKTALQHLSVTDGIARLIANNVGLQLRTDPEGFHIETLDGRGIPYTISNETVTLLEPGYSIYQIDLKSMGRSYIEVRVGTFLFEFMPTEKGLKAWVWGGAFDTPSVKRIQWPFPNWALSGRAYIWAVTVPLLKEALFIGKGPATYINDFPQKDIYGKATAGWLPNLIIDRPHNIYLQIFHASGFLSLLLFLYIGGSFLVSAYKILSRSDRVWNASTLCLLGLFGSNTAFLVNGFFNDSMVGVSPLFWISLGVGTALVSVFSPEPNEKKALTEKFKGQLYPLPT